VGSLSISTWSGCRSLLDLIAKGPRSRFFSFNHVHAIAAYTRYAARPRFMKRKAPFDLLGRQWMCQPIVSLTAPSQRVENNRVGVCLARLVKSAFFSVLGVFFSFCLSFFFGSFRSFFLFFLLPRSGSFFFLFFSSLWG